MLIIFFEAKEKKRKKLEINNFVFVDFSRCVQFLQIRVDIRGQYKIRNKFLKHCENNQDFVNLVPYNFKIENNCNFGKLP